MALNFSKQVAEYIKCDKRTKYNLCIKAITVCGENIWIDYCDDVW